MCQIEGLSCAFSWDTCVFNTPTDRFVPEERNYIIIERDIKQYSRMCIHYIPQLDGSEWLVYSYWLDTCTFISFMFMTVCNRIYNEKKNPFIFFVIISNKAMLKFCLRQQT